MGGRFAESAAADRAVGNSLSRDVLMRRSPIERTGSNAALVLEAPAVGVGRPDGCACVGQTGEKLVDSPLRRRKETDETWSDGVTGGVDVVTAVSRYLYMRDGDGQHQHVEAFEVGVAAGRSDGSPEAGCHGDGVHFDVRRLRWECVALPRHRLVHCTRGKGLDRDSPVLRLRMETTRASLLWQAAAVKPEPEKDCLV